jgi:DNA-binding winged helix-turn-helix (wHTH) protein
MLIALHEPTRELVKGDTRVRLQEQPFQIMRLLLARPGVLVTRDEIRKRLWPDGTYVDFEHSLNAAVKRLRAALGDDARMPQYPECRSTSRRCRALGIDGSTTRYRSRGGVT